MSTTKERACRSINLSFFNDDNYPDYISHLDLNVPNEKQYILRMLVREPFDSLKLPDELSWIKPMIDLSDIAQSDISIKHPFVYITIRNGIINSENDDQLHVDGFSQNITHLPEQNYIWTNHTGTEFAVKALHFPDNFDSSKHNINLFFQDNILESEVKQLESKVVYRMDPYIIHRRPKLTKETIRSFVRVSHTPIEIFDINNTPNPFIPRSYKRDGLSFRNKLKRYIE